MTVDERFTDDYLARRQDTALLGKRNPIVTGPVSDWATDFSHLEPEWAADPYPILDELRDRCPIAHTDRFGGGWLPTRYEEVAAVAYDTENFTSRSVVMSNFRPPKEIEPMGGVPPISSDPPFHHDARKLLLPAFTKTAVAKLEPATRAYCHSLIDAFEGRSDVDAATEDGKRLGAGPELLPTAMEEFLRAYAPVTMARMARHDMNWKGVDMKAEDWILLSFPAANRDPEQFERADEVVIDRKVNKHAAF